MKVFTAIFAIGAILSTTLATPVAVGETAVEQRNFEVDIAARQLPSVPGLPDLPPLPVPTNPAELASALTNALTQVVTVLAIIRAGLPDTGGLPPLPNIPTLPGVPIPPVGVPVSPEVLVAQLALLQSRLAFLQSIFTSLPAGATTDQLRGALAILGQIQGATTPIVARIRSLVGSGALPLPANLGNVEAVSAVLGTLLSLLGAVFGILPGLGN